MSSGFEPAWREELQSKGGLGVEGGEEMGEHSCGVDTFCPAKADPGSGSLFS